jgi:hypothetical protein
MSEFKGVSAVDWLSNQSYELFEQYSEGKINRITLNKMMVKATEQANKMFEEQIVESFKHGELPPLFTNLTAQQYYNETYGKKNKQ